MTTPYELMGGEDKVKELAFEFYDVMCEEERFQSLREMHEKDLSKIREELFLFLSGWLGGPHLYYKKHGTLCLDKPHKKFEITEKDRDLWLECMNKAMKRVGISCEVINMIEIPLFDLADTIKNK